MATEESRRSRAGAVRELLPAGTPRLARLTAGGLPRPSFRPSLRDWPIDSLSTALIALLVATWLSQGAAALVHVSTGTAGKVIDVGAAGVAVWIGVRIIQERRYRLLIPLIVYVGWVLTGLINTDAPSGAVATTARAWLLFPLLAGLLALEGNNERRARALIATLFALAAFEFLLTAAQLFVVPDAINNSDLIAGSFGNREGAIYGQVLLLLGCVASSGYLLGARHGRLGLIGVAVLSLASGWMYVKFATILLPVVVLLIAVTALALRKTDRRRALTAVGVILLSSAVVVGSYAIFRPAELAAIDPAQGLGNYISSGSVNGEGHEAQIGHVTVRDYWNAGVRVSSRHGISGAPPGLAAEIGNLRSGDYTADVAGPNGRLLGVSAGRAYRFTATVHAAAGPAQALLPEIEWRSGQLRIVSYTMGHTVALRPAGSSATQVEISGFAPPRAFYGVPKLAVLGNPPAGSSVLVWSPTFRAAIARSLAGAAEAHIGGVRMRDYWNSGLEPSLARPQPGKQRLTPRFRISNLTPGAYTAALTSQPSSSLRVRPGRAYRFSATITGASGTPAVVMPQIEWRTSRPASRLSNTHTVVNTSSGASVLVRPSSSVPSSSVPSPSMARHVVISGIAPPRARFAVPKLAVTGSPPAGSSIYAWSPAFRGLSGRASRGALPPARVTPSHRGARSRPPVKSPPKSSAATHRGPTMVSTRYLLLPGHLTRLRMTLHGLSGSVSSELFGHGLGSAHLPPALPGGELTPEAAASYSDAGVLLNDRGWTGVAIVALIALAFIMLAVRGVARANPGVWMTAFRLAIPGAVVAMACYALIGNGLQNHSAAITFWLIVGLGLTSRVKPNVDDD